MPKLKEAKSLLGELFLLGFQGLELGDETSALISQAHIGGVILFKHNYETPAQTAELIQQIQECKTDLPLWIAVDQEGGTVQRFKKPFCILPEAARVARAKSPRLAFELAEMMASELKAVGVNLNFAPVADIQTNPKNPVIGNRSYGTDEETVSRLVTAMVRGHLVSGVQPCVKHFPGHGDTSVDSHFELPTVQTSLEVLRDREFKPFLKAFKSRCNMVMTAHIVNPSIDPEFPATLSKKTLQDVLRGELRYSKLILSDDMEMQAITDHFGADEAPIKAIEAGCDLLLYRTEAAGRRAYQAVLNAMEDGRIKPERIIESAQRSRMIKKETLLPFSPPVVSEVSKVVGIPAHQNLIERLLNESN